MKISRKAWNEYIDKLYKCNKGAADAMWAYMKAHGIEDVEALINYGYAVATKYGEASAAIAAEMYDATAALAGASVPAAIPAETATYGEVTAAVKKSAEYSNQNTIANTVARLVKQAGADTTIQNAARDNAEWAWIPSGDTCAFCIALASRGWQYASKKVMKGDHATHIHANCDCAFAVRFDEKSSYDSYDPKKYEDIYNSAEGSSSTDKINSIRRELYKTNGDTIREQKRIAYAARKEQTSGKVSALVKSEKDDKIKAEILNFSTEEQLEAHYNKHASEFGGISKEQYLKSASSFANAELNDEIVQLTRSDGSTSKYNFTTNEFAIINADGTIRTYFKPTKKEEYWVEEIERNK
jgi:hypothetical protein